MGSHGPVAIVFGSYKIEPVEIGLNFFERHAQVQSGFDGLGSLEERSGMFEQKLRYFVGHPAGLSGQ